MTTKATRTITWRHGQKNATVTAIPTAGMSTLSTR